MRKYFLGFLLFCGLWNCYVQANSDYDAAQEIQLFHRIEPSSNPRWFENGVVTLQNINTGNVIISQPPLTKEFLQLIKESSNGDYIYRLKSVVRTSKGRELTFYSFLKMDSYVQAGHSISIVASLDHNGSVIGVKVYPKLKKVPAKSSMLNASISFKVVEPGPLPDTASYILKLEREREAKERGATPDNRSFLAKYWMYLVPLLLFAVLSGATTGDAATSAR